MSEISSNSVVAAYAALNNLEDLAFIGADSESKEALVSVWKDLVQKALPPKPVPTMAEVNWDDEDIYLAEARHEDGRVVLMIEYISESRIGFILNGTFDSAHESELTPTGTTYKIVEE